MVDPSDRLVDLRARFRQRLREEARAFRELSADSSGAGAFHEIGQRAHKLAGVSGSLGYTAITTAATPLDRSIDQLSQDPSGTQELVARLIEEIEVVLAGP